MGFAVGCEALNERERKVVRSRLMDVLNELEQGAVDSLAKEILDAMDAILNEWEDTVVNNLKNEMLDEWREERLRRALAARYYHNGLARDLSLAEILMENPPTHKSTYKRYYHLYRTGLEYKRLARPVKTYTLWWATNTGISVPKVVYDAYDVPETIGEEEL